MQIHQEKISSRLTTPDVPGYSFNSIVHPAFCQAIASSRNKCAD